MNDYDIKTRNQVRKGLKMCSVRTISKREFSNYGYEVYSKAFKNYKTFNKMDSKRIFDSEINNLTSNYDLWGVFSLEGKLIGYSKNFIQKKQTNISSSWFMHQIFSTENFLNNLHCSRMSIFLSVSGSPLTDWLNDWHEMIEKTHFNFKQD